MIFSRGAKEDGGHAKQPTIVFCCNRLAPTLELAFVMRAMVVADMYPLALLESDRLLQQLQPSTLARVHISVLPRLLGRYGPITIPRIIGALGKACRLLQLDVFSDVFATIRGVVTGDVALRRLQKQYDIRMVIVADDRSLGWEFGAVYSARRQGLPTAAIPFALSDPKADWLARKERSAFDLARAGWLSRFFKRKMALQYPANVHHEDGRALMFLSAGQAWALQTLGAAWPQPWAYGGGITDVAAVFGEVDLAKQVALGVPATKLIVTGQSSLDSLYALRDSSATIRKKLLAECSLPADRRVVVCAVPQYLEHGMLEAREHWRLTEQMLSSLARTGANVLLSLHPRSLRSDYQPLAERFGAVVVRQPLIQILPAADLFVATHSSTVRWAILLSTPVIVLDDFDLGYEAMYAGGGVRFLKNRTELEALARRSLDDPDYRASIQAALKRQAQGMDPFDGKNSARVMAMVRGRMHSV